MSIVGFDYVLQGSALCNIANGVGFYTHRFVGMFLGDFNKCWYAKMALLQEGVFDSAQSGPELQSLKKRAYVDLHGPEMFCLYPLFSSDRIR